MLSLSDTGPFAPCPAPFNLAGYVLDMGQQTPDKLALAVVGVSRTDRWSYARLRQAVLGTATGLLEAGGKPGDRVLMRLGNTVDFPIAYLGAIAAGMVPVPTSTQLTDAEVAGILTELQPRLVLHAEGVSCPETEIGTGTTKLDLASLRDMHDLPPTTPHMGDPERPAYIVYTSGTSGSPRAVEHAHRAIWARQMMIRDWYDLGCDDRLMHAGAFNWTYTLGTGLMDPWTVGAMAVIPDPHMAPAQLPLILKRHDITIFAAVPGVYRKMLASHGTLALPRLRHGLSAGEKLTEALRQHWTEATGTGIYEAFGMSECSTFISASPERPAEGGSLGRPQRGRHVALIGDTGPVRLGETGVIAVHRSDPGLMLGYIDAPDETRARYQGDWFLTGDLATMQEDGQLFYQGRADDMMNAGGYRVSPIEVEHVLTAHPVITHAAVTDIEVKPDVRLIMAFYTAPEPVAEAELKSYVEARLATYKRPRGFFHLESLPTNPNGKLQRRALAQIYKELHGQT